MKRMAKSIFARIEWAFWQKLLPNRFHRLVTKLTLFIMATRLPGNVLDHWIWEMTPMPCGFPFPHQHLEGIEMAVRGRSGWAIVAERSRNRFDMKWKELMERRQRMNEEA